MSDKRRILDFYAGKSWAILEANLQEMYQIYQARVARGDLGIDFDPEAVAAKSGTRLDNTRKVDVREGGVAIIPVTGPIFGRANMITECSGATSIEMLAKDFNQALENPRVKSIILNINSPGGEVDGTSEFAQHIFDARGQKPIIAYVAHLGASAAYWIASAADEIVAQETASMGSIGVVGTVSVHKDKNQIEFVSSQSPNKRPNPETEDGRSRIQEHIDDLAQVFIDTVARNRGWTADEVLERGGRGGLKVGQKAVTSGLADRLGTFEGLITELSDTSKPYVSSHTQNLKQSSVVETSTDELLTTGAKDMADKAGEEKDKKPTADLEPPKTDAKPPVVDAKADPSAELEAARKAQSDTEAQLKAERLASEQQAAKIKGLEDGMAALQKENRAVRFREIAKDWSGNADHHVSMLETLSQMEGGETSALFTGYVTQQKATAEQLKEGALFKELGSSGPAEGSAEAQANTKATDLMAADKTLTKEQALEKVYAADPALYGRVREEERKSVN